ncbi:hypothetical protein SAMN05660420_03076 [Desulfuromusa kysingii]|uniref:Uncharacterized protein n=1 Tax=Desulfuromusa kysingii TaxID=37625 RepID=A0A1H4DRV6_9BACT|nr:hypothetical protein SAMN05660420_03076 [Desulfuromusa kysingii]
MWLIWFKDKQELFSIDPTITGLSSLSFDKVIKELDTRDDFMKAYTKKVQNETTIGTDDLTRSCNENTEITG